MKSSSGKDFTVYEFKNEDQEIESIANGLVEKFNRSSRKTNLEEFMLPKVGDDSSPLNKYQHLKTYASSAKSQGKRMNCISCVDVKTCDSNHKCENHGVRTLGTVDGSDSSIKEGNDGSEKISVMNSINCREDAHTNTDDVENGNLVPRFSSVSSFKASCWSENPLVTEVTNHALPSPENMQINFDHSELPSNYIPRDVISDNEGSETCSSDSREDQGSSEGSGSDHYPGDWEMEDISMEVVITPDYVVYKDLYSTVSTIWFSSSYIKFEGVNSSRSKDICCSEWRVVDVIAIETEWWAKAKVATVQLSVRCFDDMETEIHDGTSGIVQLKFAVGDHHWFERQERIMSMHARYKDTWRSFEATFGGRNQICRPKCWRPIFDEPFEDVIYPAGDPDAVSISKRDVELLHPNTFINDTIVDFYIKYLKNKIKPEDRNRFYFFNSFFFRKLADLDKNPSSASEGSAAFLRVRKWTRKVNLFDKDYIFIPVNFNLHWSLIVICHPGEVATFVDEDVGKSLKVPCILHMDSIKGSHKGLTKLVQSYLWEEWKERQKEPSEDYSMNFFNLRFVPLELPQQENSFDCGFFLLYYVERFLDEAPLYLNPFKLETGSTFLKFDWFPPAEASLRRTFIRNLIYDLIRDHSQTIPSVAQDRHSSQSMGNNTGKEKAYNTEKEKAYNTGKEKSYDYPLEGHIAANSCSSFSFCPNNDDQRIEIKLLRSPGPAQFCRESGLVLKELFEMESTTGLPDGQLPSFDQIKSYNKFKAVMTPIKEDDEIHEQFAFSPSGGEGQLVGYTVDDACTASTSYKDFELYNMLPNPGILMERKRNDHGDTLASEAFCSDSQSSSGGIVDETLPGEENSRSISSASSFNSTESANSGCSEELGNRIVEDSQEVDRVAGDEDEKKSCLFSCQEKFSASSGNCQTDVGENEIHLGEIPNLSYEMTTSEPVERAAKRTKVTLSLKS